MKARGVGVEKAVDDYETVKAKLGENVDTSGSRFNDAFRIAREENKRQEGIFFYVHRRSHTRTRNLLACLLEFSTRPAKIVAFCLP